MSKTVSWIDHCHGNDIQNSHYHWSLRSVASFVFMFRHRWIHPTAECCSSEGPQLYIVLMRVFRLIIRLIDKRSKDWIKTLWTHKSSEDAFACWVTLGSVAGFCGFWEYFGSSASWESWVLKHGLAYTIGIKSSLQHTGQFCWVKGCISLRLAWSMLFNLSFGLHPQNYGRKKRPIWVHVVLSFRPYWYAVASFCLHRILIHWTCWNEFGDEKIKPVKLSLTIGIGVLIHRLCIPGQCYLRFDTLRVWCNFDQARQRKNVPKPYRWLNEVIERPGFHIATWAKMKFRSFLAWYQSENRWKPGMHWKIRVEMWIAPSLGSAKSTS